MARWRLRNAHYLNIIDPDSEDGDSVQWEYKEQDRVTGKMRRKVFDVPHLLDPKDPQVCNYPGEIIVCYEGKGEAKDIIFLGEPTPDMEALDEEAEAISAALEYKWTHPMESLPANGGMDSKEAAFMQQMMDTFAKAVGGANVPKGNTSIDPQAQIDELKAQLEEMRTIMANQSPSSPLPDDATGNEEEIEEELPLPPPIAAKPAIARRA